MNSTMSTHAVILLIDNNPLSRSGLAAILDMAGHRCHGACDAQDTLKALDGLDLDLIICNVDFDGDSSPALFQKLAIVGQNRGIPLVFRASAAPHPTLDRVLASGDALFLPHPFSHEDLLRTVERALWMPHLIRQHTVSRASGSQADGPSVNRSAAGLKLDGHAAHPAASRRPHAAGLPRHQDAAALVMAGMPGIPR